MRSGRERQTDTDTILAGQSGQCVAAVHCYAATVGLRPLFLEEFTTSVLGTANRKIHIYEPFWLHKQVMCEHSKINETQ